MNATLYQQLELLTNSEKRALGEALIVSSENEAAAPLPTAEQREELRVRLAHHRANPNEPGVTFAQLKAQLFALPKQA